MADKHPPTLPTTVSFAAGEQPAASKLNALHNGPAAAFSTLEQVVGDPWNGSGDTLFGTMPLQQPNIARVLGPIAQLNPEFTPPSSGSTWQYSQSLVPWRGHRIIDLDFPAQNTSVLTASLSAAGVSGSVVLGTEADVAAGVIVIDNTRLKLYLPANIAIGATELSYAVASSHGVPRGWNVIPNPNQSEWRGVKIVQITSSKYLLYSPPKSPVSSAANSRTPVASNNRAVAGETTRKAYYLSTASWVTGTINWSSPTSLQALARVADYRMEFLPELTAFILAQPAGTTLSGIMLWDNSLQAPVPGVTFRIPDDNSLPYGGTVTPRPSWVIQVEGNTLSALFSGQTSAATTDNPADYRSRFSLVCVGQSTAHLLNRAWNKDRDVMSHAAMQDVSMSGVYPSKLANDHHPQYLLRVGNSGRDVVQGGMLDHIIFAQTTNDLGTTGTTYGVKWGASSLAPSLKVQSGAHTTPAGMTAAGVGLLLDTPSAVLVLAKPWIKLGNEEGFFFRDSENLHVYGQDELNRVNVHAKSFHARQVATVEAVDASSPGDGAVQYGVNLEHNSSTGYIISGSGADKKVYIGTGAGGNHLVLTDNEVWLDSDGTMRLQKIDSGALVGTSYLKVTEGAAFGETRMRALVLTEPGFISPTLLLQEESSVTTNDSSSTIQRLGISSAVSVGGTMTADRFRLSDTTHIREIFLPLTSCKYRNPPGGGAAAFYEELGVDGDVASPATNEIAYWDVTNLLGKDPIFVSVEIILEAHGATVTSQNYAWSLMRGLAALVGTSDLRVASGITLTRTGSGLTHAQTASTNSRGISGTASVSSLTSGSRATATISASGNKRILVEDGGSERIWTPDDGAQFVLELSGSGSTNRMRVVGVKLTLRFETLNDMLGV